MLSFIDFGELLQSSVIIGSEFSSLTNYFFNQNRINTGDSVCQLVKMSGLRLSFLLNMSLLAIMVSIPITKGVGASKPCSSNATNPFPGKCGHFESPQSMSIESRIISGVNSTPGKIPWQAQLWRGCGGSIINPWQVVTAAHCVHKNIIGENVTAGHFLSSWKKTDDNSSDCTKQVRHVADVKVHPCNCNSGLGCALDFSYLQYDIAVLTVDTPFKFNAFVQPVCLAQSFEQYPAGTNVMVSGWGKTESGRSSDLLQFVWIPTISNQECARIYPIMFKDDMICAGFKENRKGSCQGDSGGPLVKLDKENRATLVGVVSWGQDITCDKPKYPSVFAKVSHVVDWIQSLEYYPEAKNMSSREVRLRFDPWECCAYLQNNSSMQNMTRKNITTEQTLVCPPSLTNEDCISASSNVSVPTSGPCGYFNNSRLPIPQPHIANGHDAAYGQIPWQAQLSECGAVIIDHLHLLTTANCVHNKRIGGHVEAGHIRSAFIYDDEECTKQVRKIVNVSIHPCYCKDSGGCDSDNTFLQTNQNDIALLTIDKAFDFNDFVQPVCLPIPFSEVAPKTRVMTSGWGDSESERKADTLQFVWMSTVPNPQCNESYSRREIVEDMICAGVPDGEKQPCPYDWGGPLVVVEKNHATLVGVVSTAACGLMYTPPSIYTKVSHFVDWVDEMIQNQHIHSSEDIDNSFNQKKCNQYRYSLTTTSATTTQFTTASTTLAPTTMDIPIANTCSLGSLSMVLFMLSLAMIQQNLLYQLQ